MLLILEVSAKEKNNKEDRKTKKKKMGRKRKETIPYKRRNRQFYVCLAR
jgi:hypothetical protein